MGPFIDSRSLSLLTLNELGDANSASLYIGRGVSTIPQEILDLSGWVAGRAYSPILTNVLGSESPADLRFTTNDWDPDKHSRDEKGRFGSGGGASGAIGKTSGGGKGFAGGAHGGAELRSSGPQSGHEEGIDIEARPVRGEGKVGAPQNIKDVDTRRLGAVDKWLAGEGKKGPSGPVGKAVGAVAETLKSALHKVEGAAGAAIGAAARATKDTAARWGASLPKPVQPLVGATFMVLRTMSGLGRLAVKAGLPAAFVIWTAPQHVALKIAERKGATPEQAKKIQSALSAIDMAALEVAKVGWALTGLPAAAGWAVGKVGAHALGHAIGEVGGAGLEHAHEGFHAMAGKVGLYPAATSAYLAGNLVAHPVHTIKAAGDLIKDVAKATVGGVLSPKASIKQAGRWVAREFKAGYGVGGTTPTREGAKAVQAKALAESKGPKVARKEAVHHTSSVWVPTLTINTRYGQYVINAPTDRTQPPTDEHMESVGMMVADALEAHDYSSWYMALFAVALDQGEKVPDAIATADAAYEAQPEDPTPDGLDPSAGDDAAALHAIYGHTFSAA